MHNLNGPAKRSALRGGALLCATALAGGLLASHPASAQSASQLQAIQAQIQELQTQLRRLQRQAAERDAALKQAQTDAAQARAQAAQASQAAQTAQAQSAQVQSVQASQARAGGFTTQGPEQPLILSAPSTPPTLAGSSPQAIVGTAVDKLNPTFRLGGITITLGGFTDITGIYRSRNETAGTGTSFNGIPFSSAQNAHTSEVRGTAQVSRFSMLVQGHPSDSSTIAGYAELDLNGAGTTSNSAQSNSYTPRVRQLYAQYDDSRYGIHLLAGQAWSFLTGETVGMVPRKEQIPLVIDTNYLPGFTYTRNAQIRVDKDFGQKYWVGLSLEAPQESYSFPVASGGTLPLLPGQKVGATIDYSNPGSGNLNSSANYSVDVAPDIIVKAAADPGYGHYEVYGLGRWFKSRVSVVGAGSDKVAFGGGVGANATIPVIPKFLDLTGDVLAGYGIGRYGAGQLPDATFSASGAPSPLPEVAGMVGLIGHPTKTVDLYGYAGMEQVGRKTFKVGTTVDGYGASNVVNTGCDIELDTSTCNAQTRSLVGAAVGGWWRFLHGNYGTMLAGAQYGYTKRIAFHGVGGRPTTDENAVMVSLRYLPFQ